MSLTFFAAQDFPGGPLPVEAAYRTMTEIDQHTKGKGEDTNLISANPESDAVKHVRMNGIESEVSVGSTSSLEAAKAEQDLNIHSEIPMVPEASSDESPENTPQSAFHAIVNAKDRTVDVENHVPKDGIRTNSASGNDAVTPVPLVNGYEEATRVAEIQSYPHNDIWSPATKLKRRLEDTKDLIVCPGVYDGFSARIALSVGFDTMYMVRKCVLDAAGIIERQIRADGQADRCRDHCFEIGHGRPGSS